MFFFRNNEGFTLLEAIISIAIFALLGLAVSSFLIDSFRSQRVVWDQLQAQGDGRKVIAQVMDYARRAEQSSIGGYPIVTAGANEFTFYSNTDLDGYKERIRYFLDGTNFKRGIIKPSGNPLAYNQANEQIVTMATGIRNSVSSTPVFLYYDQNYNGSGSALVQPVNVQDVRLVLIQLQLDKEINKSPVPIFVEGMAGIRVLKSN